ncbi:COG1470 family protein [Schlesneria paludicola]|uniref:COG1470 family protein n=1 Tax=Schlesneria paludicola TaxID=360056 RepID=UPI00058B4748|nr:hypothetical protein [Schlesneria paludicola]
MLKSSSAFVGLALLAASGCMQGTSGGPGAQTPPASQPHSANKPVITESEKPALSQPRDTFSLRLPILSTSLKQGESKSVTISIQRGTDFDQDVTLNFSNMPSGVTLSPAAPMITKEEKETKVSVLAAEDAALGDFTVNVSGHSSKGGPDATNELKLSVSAK